jgi:hypothetical protein
MSKKMFPRQTWTFRKTMNSLLQGAPTVDDKGGG